MRLTVLCLPAEKAGSLLVFGSVVKLVLITLTEGACRRVTLLDDLRRVTGAVSVAGVVLGTCHGLSVLAGIHLGWASTGSRLSVFFLCSRVVGPGMKNMQCVSTFNKTSPIRI